MVRLCRAAVPRNQPPAIATAPSGPAEPDRSQPRAAPRVGRARGGLSTGPLGFGAGAACGAAARGHLLQAARQLPAAATIRQPLSPHQAVRRSVHLAAVERQLHLVPARPLRDRRCLSDLVSDRHRSGSRRCPGPLQGGREAVDVNVRLQRILRDARVQASSTSRRSDHGEGGV